ncbi:hypothetical protein WG66_001565 [Moniliophthora roreri]|nr:hypothetical protein WG66_001565 [Moniliophthora roreri]
MGLHKMSPNPSTCNTSMEQNPPFLPFPNAKSFASASFKAQSGRHIDSLPVEILIMIFLYVRDNPPERFDFYRNPIDDSLNPINDDALPWTLCKVSQRWRTIAENTPDLWRIANVEMTWDKGRLMDSKAGKTILQRIIEMITTWLANAKYLSSDKGVLELSYRSTKWDVGDYDVAILKTILEYAEWMKSFGILADFKMMPHLEILAGRTQRLEALKIETLGMGIYNRLDLKAFADAPRLRSAEIAWVTEFWRTVQLPWSQLTECNVNERWITDGLGALVVAGLNITRARITTHENTDYNNTKLAAFDSFGMVVVPKLRSLEYAGGDEPYGFHYRCALTKMILPSLEELILRQWKKFVYGYAVDMIERSGARLTRLELYHTYRNKLQDVEALIAYAMPSLKTLVVDINSDALEQPNADNILLFLLKEMRGPKPGFASLETLRVVARCCHERQYNRFDYRLLVKLLEETRNRNKRSSFGVSLRTEIEVLGELTPEYVNLTEQLLTSGCQMKEKPMRRFHKTLRNFYV